MKKRLISLLLIAVFLLSFSACSKSSVISAEKAQEIAFQDAGVSASDVQDVHNHPTQAEDGTACYNIHFTAKGQPYNYMISAEGEIVSFAHEAGH